ncbi:hypothetical protein MYX76_13920 [Desulfobacterota bacterium AH_259_B03_O07]|nr:hypothetical protein [Desulfobacterota bacterium AH_259_B03_O07]
MKNTSPTPEEIKEENKKIRRLRFMVNLNLSLIYQSNMTREAALEHFIKVKKYALRLFPGKEQAFELIYAPRFKRLIIEKYGVH